MLPGGRCQEEDWWIFDREDMAGMDERERRKGGRKRDCDEFGKGEKTGSSGGDMVGTIFCISVPSCVSTEGSSAMCAHHLLYFVHNVYTLSRAGM